MASARKEEYDDIIKHIQRVAKRIHDDCDEQMNRLDEFEDKNMSPDAVKNIPDQDVVFLKKEVARYQASLDVV